MTREPLGTQDGSANLFDRIVAHERSEDARLTGSLRPRVPYVFDGMPIHEPAIEPETQAPEVVPVLRETHPIQLPAPNVLSAPSNVERERPSKAHASEEGSVSPALTLHATAMRDAASNAPPLNAELRAATAAPTPSMARTAEREQATASRQHSGSIAPEPGIVERVASRRIEQTPPAQRAASREGGLRSRAELRAVPLPPVIAPPVEPIIEIRIGRIDVRAPSASSAQPPAPRAGASAPDRLGPYLGRRTRGARS